LWIFKKGGSDGRIIAINNSESKGSAKFIRVSWLEGIRCKKKSIKFRIIKKHTKRE